MAEAQQLGRVGDPRVRQCAMRLERQLVVAGIALSALAIAQSAEGASEAHFGGDDVRITVDEAGLAHVEHALSYRVTGSPPKGFDLTGIEPEALVDPVAQVALDGETINAGNVERRGETALRISLDGAPRRLTGHAVIAVRVSYTLDLVQTHHLTLDGAMWRLAWTAPFAPEGYDAARVIFDLPAAPTEPRILAADGSVGDDGRVVTLRRGPQRDELEMARPHIARGEAAPWMARVDPRAFPRVVDPSLRPPPALPERAEGRGAAAWLIAALAGALFGALVRLKSSRFARACASRGVAAGALVGWASPLARAWLAALAFAAGVACEGANHYLCGALAIALAMLAATSRAPRVSASPRGPGQWLPLSPDEAFAPERASDALDLATLSGKGALFVAVAGAIALGLALRPFAPIWLWLAPLDALALVPLFVTGSRAQLPPDRASSPKPRLAALHRLLRRDAALRVAPWARVPLGASAPDELRLLVLPRAAMPGVVGIEIGVAWIATPAGYAAETEVLVRVREATAAAARLVALGPHRRPVHGRKTDERVVRLVPSLPSRAGAVALVRRLAQELRDRRKSLPGVKWPGAERRLPPNERAPAPKAKAGTGVPAAA
jgi:hypothetical protein